MLHGTIIQNQRRGMIMKDDGWCRTGDNPGFVIILQDKWHCDTTHIMCNAFPECGPRSQLPGCTPCHSLRRLSYNKLFSIYLCFHPSLPDNKLTFYSLFGMNIYPFQENPYGN